MIVVNDDRCQRILRTSPGNCPKSLGHTHSVALRATEKLLLVHFVLRILAKFALGALLESLFGQSLYGVLGSWLRNVSKDAPYG
jgi:hypothetical protein